jgi:hypothetical protein
MTDQFACNRAESLELDRHRVDDCVVSILRVNRGSGRLHLPLCGACDFWLRRRRCRNQVRVRLHISAAAKANAWLVVAAVVRAAPSI